MKIIATINESEMKKTLRKWERLTGKGVEEGIEQMARSTARPLSETVQPWSGRGSKGKSAMAKFIKNIELQVSQVWVGINLGYYELQGSFESTYNNLRRRGVIRHRKFRSRMGRRWRWIVSEQEKDMLVKKQQDKAGRAKAGWIAAGYSVNRKRLDSGNRYVQRHVRSGYGHAQKTGRGMDAEIELHNRTPYLKAIQKRADLERALKRGRRNGMTSLNRAIRAQIKKANQ